MIKRASGILYFRVLIIIGIIAQLAWYGLLWSRMFTQPDISRPGDFSIFYTAGRIAATGHITQVYDLQSQLAVQEKLLGYSFPLSQLLPFNHPPLLVPILQLICSQDYMASYWRWVLVMVCFILATLVIIDRLLLAMQWNQDARLTFIICCGLFYPIFVGLLKGQDTAFLLFGCMFWFFGLAVKKDSMAGLGLALTIIRPQIALVLAVPFLFNYRKVWWWFLGGAVVLGLYSLALVRLEGARDFINLLKISAAGQGFGMNQAAMFNFTGMALRLFPFASLDLVHIVAWGLFLAAVVGLSVWWKVSPEIHLHHIVLAVTLSMFTAPHLHYHDLILLLIPVIGLVLILVKHQKLKPAGAAATVVLISVIWMVGEIWEFSRLTFPYLLMAFLPFAAWFYEKH